MSISWCCGNSLKRYNGSPITYSQTQNHQDARLPPPSKRSKKSKKVDTPQTKVTFEASLQYDHASFPSSRSVHSFLFSILHPIYSQKIPFSSSLQ